MEENPLTSMPRSDIYICPDGTQKAHGAVECDFNHSLKI